MQFKLIISLNLKFAKIFYSLFLNQKEVNATINQYLIKR